MRNAWTIARREYRQYFISPIAYIIALLILLVSGIVFTIVISNSAGSAMSGQSTPPGPDMVVYIMSYLFLLALPAVSMRLVADEHRTGTLELLLTAPVQNWELVVGKWLGAFLFILSIIAVTLLYPISSFFNNQFAAFFATLFVLFFLWSVIGWTSYLTPNSTGIFDYLSMSKHFNSMLGGTIALPDIVYFLSLTVLGLFLGTTAVEIRRWK